MRIMWRVQLLLLFLSCSTANGQQVTFGFGGGASSIMRGTMTPGVGFLSVGYQNGHGRYEYRLSGMTGSSNHNTYTLNYYDSRFLAYGRVNYGIAWLSAGSGFGWQRLTRKGEEPQFSRFNIFFPLGLDVSLEAGPFGFGFEWQKFISQYRPETMSVIHARILLDTKLLF